MNIFRHFWLDDSAQDIAEYAIMSAVLLVVTIVTIQAIGGAANNIFSKIANLLGSVS